MKKYIFFILLVCFCNVNAQQNNSNTNKSKLIGNGLQLVVQDCIGDSMSNSITLFFSITNPNLSSQKIKIDIGEKFPALAFDNKGDKYYHSKIMLAGITAHHTVETQIPSGVSVWGCITYSNVNPSLSSFELVTFPMGSCNFNGNQEIKNEWIEIKNVPIVWNMGKTPSLNYVGGTLSYLNENSLKKMNNGLDFTFLKCEGDINTQTTTVFFTVSNVNKANLKIKIDPWGLQKAMLIDNKGYNFTFHSAKLGNFSNNGIVECDLPTGVLTKGSITFRNMMPSSNSIALIDIPLAWKYATEYSYFDVDEEKVELRNLKINWQAPSVINESKFPYLVKTVNSGVEMYITGCKGNKASQTVTVFYSFYNKLSPIQQISTNPWAYSRSNAIDNLGNNYSFDKNCLGTTISNGIIEKVLPTNLVLNGSLSFKDVLPSISTFALANIPVNIKSWKGNENQFNDVVHLKSLSIDWDNKTSILTNEQFESFVNKPIEKEDDNYTKPKKLTAGCEFQFVECQGDSASQTVTVFFKINNPGKAHQKVNIDPWFGTYAKAIDEYGNDYKFGNLNLGRQYGNGYLKAELLSGLFVNGFIAFKEVETRSNFLNYMSIPIYCKNRLDNNEKDYEIIELRNVKINWQ
jgi:hypothetical protein